MTLTTANGPISTIETGIDAAAATVQPRFTDLIGVATMYGISPSTVLRMADRGKLPYGIKMGARRLWRIRDLDEHIAAGCPQIRKSAAR
jgi:hypothetical protein